MNINTKIYMFCAGVLTALAMIAMASPAHADNEFVMCDDGHEGVVGHHTTCAFAANVRRTFYATGQARQFIAYSPATGQAYAMDCGSITPVHFVNGVTVNGIRCYGGDDAEVVVW